jgi:hypothetical protein
MRRRTQTNPLAAYRVCDDVSVFVVQSPDCEEAIEADRLERSHRRLRPDEDEQLASLRMLASASITTYEPLSATTTPWPGDSCPALTRDRGPLSTSS